VDYLILIIKEGFPKIVPYDPQSEVQRGLTITDGKWTYNEVISQVGQTRFIGNRDRKGVIGVYFKDPSPENIDRIAMHFHECIRKEED